MCGIGAEFDLMLEEQELQFEDKVRRLVQQYPNDKNLGSKIREMCDE